MWQGKDLREVDLADDCKRARTMGTVGWDLG
jgi:hypothetical protein